MDGVLSNWMDKACETVDVDPTDDKIRSQLKGGAWLDDIRGIDEKDMWDKISAGGTDWWANLEIFDWSKRLVNRMKKEGEVYFLTSPGSCIPAPSGKMQWIENHLQMVEQLIIAKDKHLCAGPNRLLIDDSEKKIEAFRKNGGHAFHWPMQYRIDDGDENIDDVFEKLLYDIKGYKK